MIVRIKAHLNPGSLKPHFKDQAGIGINARLTKIFERIRAGKLYGLESKDIASAKISELKKIDRAQYAMEPHLPSELDRAFKVLRYYPKSREFEIELLKPLALGPNTRIGIAYLMVEDGEVSSVIDAPFAYPVEVELRA